MFTRNWYNAFVGDQFYRKPIPVKLPTGVETTVEVSSIRLYNGLSTIKTDGLDTNRNRGVVFGNGTTPPTLDDYTMAGDRFTTVTGTIVYDFEVTKNGIQHTALYTITNTGDTDFTISEIGLFDSPYGNYIALLERTVLDSPVTIPAGGVGQITYTIRMNYPTA